jgi:hypothetical protein
MPRHPRQARGGPEQIVFNQFLGQLFPPSRHKLQLLLALQPEELPRQGINAGAIMLKSNSRLLAGSVRG